MKTLNQQPLKECESTSITSALPSFSGLRLWLNHVQTKARSFNPGSVRQAARTTLNVSLLCLRRLFQNKRHLVGSVLLAGAVVSLFAAQLFCDFWSRDHAVCRVLGFPVTQCDLQTGWCFINWFYYIHTIKWCLFIILGSVGGILFVPTKYSLSFIPFSVAQATGWVWIFHYSFYVRSNETFHAFPDWQIIVIGLSLGFSIVMSANHLIYWFNHRTLAIEKRLGTLYNGLPYLDGDTFKEQYKKFYEQKQAYEKQY